MDVDVLTAEKQTEYMKKELCFNCGKSGHLSGRDCGEKKKPPSYASTWAPADQMDEKEREVFYKEAEKEGF